MYEAPASASSLNTWVYNGNNLSTAFSNSPSARPLDKATYVIGPVITGLAYLLRFLLLLYISLIDEYCLI